MTDQTTATTIDQQQLLGQVKEWAIIAAQAADAKNGTETIILEVGKVLAITDFFVVTTGTSTRQVRTIADEVELQIRAATGVNPLRVEGAREGQWVLLDYGDIVVHVFLNDMRDFYEIERLYKDVPVIGWTPLTPAPPVTPVIG